MQKVAKTLKKCKLNFLSDGLDLPEFIVFWLFIGDIVLVFIVLSNILLSTFGIWEYSPELFEFFKYLSMAQLAPAILGSAGYQSVRVYADRTQYSKGPQTYDGYYGNYNDYEEGPPI